MAGQPRFGRGRPVRILAPAFAVVLLLTLVAGSQPRYPMFLLVVLLAAGCAARVRLPWPSPASTPTEELGQPISFCRDRSGPWAETWEELRHLD